MDIIRKVSQQFPLEIDAFEQRCATMVFDLSELGSKLAASGSQHPSGRARTNQTLVVDDRKRAMSLTSLDGAVRALRPRPSMVVMSKDSVVLPSETRKEKAPPRIAFIDYMIKPIQRICKYPLLLDQLLPSKALRTLSQNTPEARSDVDVVVQSAAQAMRHVAASVDEARHRQDVAIQSALIFSRICVGMSSASSVPSFQTLTPEFFSSLGNCLLSGSLDVMHYHRNSPLGQTSNIKAKYLGAFLYPGGYLVLVKVCKGKKYEPRHWFSLADFEVSDVEENGGTLHFWTLSVGLLIHIPVLTQPCCHAPSDFHLAKSISNWQRLVNERKIHGLAPSMNPSPGLVSGSMSRHPASGLTAKASFSPSRKTVTLSLSAGCQRSVRFLSLPTPQIQRRLSPSLHLSVETRERGRTKLDTKILRVSDTIYLLHRVVDHPQRL